MSDGVKITALAIGGPQEPKPNPWALVNRSLAAILRRLVAVEKRPAARDGDPGPMGERGPAGEIGPQGIQGERGTMGERGERGEQGPQGERGEPGPEGPSGRDGVGIQGERGADGRDGRDGRDGIAGRSIVRAEVIDGVLALTFTDGTTETVGRVVGERGETGPAGERGEQGPRGESGERGPIGERGTPGVAGQPGPRGARGEAAAPPEIEFGQPEEITIEADQLHRLRVQRVTIAGAELAVLTLADD